MRKVERKNGGAQLTSRQLSIIQILLQSAPEPVTLAAISKELEFSSRTILRELDAIEKWFRENDFSFLRKPGVGLSIPESTEGLRRIQKLIGAEPVRATYSRKERRRQLLGELLYAREPIKSYVFSSRFHISEGTLSSDLDEVEKWLDTYHIRLIRRPGVGIFLEGSENDYRQAIANAAFEYTDEGELLRLLRGRKGTESAESQPIFGERLFGYIDPQIVSFVEKIMVSSEKELGIQYTDSGYMALVVHLSLAIHRLMSGEVIEMDEDNLEELLKMPEFATATQIARQISQHFRLEIPREEIGFITMHLATARVWPKGRPGRGQLQSINTSQVVMAIVNTVETELNLPFHTCGRMIEELISHMDSMISRLSMNIHLENTQVENIQTNYPDIYAAVERGCSVFKDLLRIKDVSPSEITFVAMHFVAAAETLRVEQKRVTVAVVCPSGMGASRMLAANLMRTFHNLEIRQIMSAFSLDQESLKDSGVDLVISTVPLQLDYPCICVNPIPQAQDILLITQTVERINENRAKNVPVQKRTSDSVPMVTLAQISRMNTIGREILEVLQHFSIRTLSGVQHKEELLGEAAGLFADSILTRRIISNDLARRETYASTFLPEMKLHLLHCKTAAIEHCRFGYLKLEKPIYTDGNPLLGAVILLAPMSGGEEHIAVISQFSMLLAENDSFLQALRAGDLIGAKALAEQALVRFYQSETTRIGDGKL